MLMIFAMVLAYVCPLVSMAKTNYTNYLALGDDERSMLDEKLKEFRKDFNDMVILSFPGDEKYTGGCLSANLKEITSS